MFGKKKKDKNTQDVPIQQIDEAQQMMFGQASNMQVEQPAYESPEFAPTVAPQERPQSTAPTPQTPVIAIDPVAMQQQLAPTPPPQPTPQQDTGDPAAQVNYNNIMPGSAGEAGQEVELPDEASVISVKKEKVKKPLKRYRYTVINNIGKKENGTFDAEEENDVRNYLLGLDYQVLEVAERSKSDIDIGSTHIKPADLSFSLTQLSTYLKAGIPLADSVKILAKQTKRPALKKSFNQLVYQLLKGESFSAAMMMQEEVYPQLLVNMIKTAEMTGDLPSILDDMAEYYTSMDQTAKQMKSAMTYPIVVLTIAVAVLIFMLTYLVPQFTSMFEANGTELPALTKAIVNVSNFIKEKWYLIIIFIVAVVGGFYYAFKNSKAFREKVQIVLMHTPVFKDIIIYNETANFTKTFASLLNHGVFITDSMEILSKITSNEVFKRIISKTLENLAKGDSISTAFRGEWAIPIVAYEMIVTGESTGQLGQMMEKVASHFQMMHKNVIDQMKSLVEPLMICFLAVVVGTILVAIIQPMFAMYDSVK